jgi:hypothetical protein
MHVIKSYRDLQELKKDEAVSSALITYTESMFTSLCQSLGDGQAVQEFTLDTHGPIGILQPGQTNLKPIGLEQELIETWPEFVEKIILSDGQTLFSVGILIDNDYVVLLYLLAKDASPSILEWLEYQAEPVPEGGGNSGYTTDPF